MTATTTRPTRNQHGACPQCNAHPNSFHKQSCSCDQLGHQWGSTTWDDDELARACGYCGKITGGPRMRNDDHA